MADVARVAITAVGYYFGGPIGGMIGSAIGSMLFPADPIQVEGPRLTDLKSQISSPGGAIPVLFGTNRITGNVIASSNKIETKHVESQGGKGGGPSTESTTYTYSIHAAIALCQGPAYVTRIWANKKLIYSTTSKDLASIASSKIGHADTIRFYSGSETQASDALVEQLTGSDCAYRGTCYVVFQNLQLEDFGNELPQFEFEVCSTATFENWAMCQDFIGSVGTQHVYQIYQVDASGVYYMINYLYGTPLNRRYTDLVYYNFSSNKHQLIKRDVIANNVYMRAENFSGNDKSSKATGIFVLNKGYNDVGTELDSTTREIYIYSAKSANITEFFGAKYFDYDIHFDGTPLLISDNALTFSNKYYISLSNERYELENGSFFGTTKNYIIVINEKNNNRRRIDYSAYFDTNNILKDVPLRIFIYDDILFISSSDASDKVVFVTLNLLTNEFNHVVTNIDVNAAGGIPSIQKIDGQYFVCKSESSGEVLLVNRETYSVDKSMKLNGQSGTDVLSDDVVTGVSNIGCLEYFDGFLAVDGGAGGGAKLCINRDKANYNLVNNRDIVKYLLDKTGIETSEYDVTNLNGSSVGYKISQSMTIRDAIEPIQKIEPFDAKESNGQLVFSSRNNNAMSSILKDKMSFNDNTQPLDEYYVLNQVPIDEVPIEVNVKYVDISRDHDINTETARREQRPMRSQKNSTDIEVPFVLNKASGQRIARQQLYDAWSFKDNYEFSASREFEVLEPGDVISIETDSGFISVRITEKENNGYNIIKFKAQKTSTVLNRVVDEDTVQNNFDGSKLSSVGPTNMRFLDLPPLTDSINQSGFYFAAEGYGSNRWNGCNIYKSSDNGLTYSNYQSVNKKSNIGYTLNALNAWSDQDIIDSVNYVEVYSDKELSSISQDTMLSSKTVNMALIGSEIIQYQNAELIDVNTYRLSNLRRCLKQTSSTSHAINEDFIQLDFNVQLFSQDLSENNVSKLYNIVSFGKTLSDSINVSFTNTNSIIKPLSPLIDIGRYTDGLHINFTRQFRSNEQLRDLTDIPEDDSGTFTFYVYIYDGATFKRTLSTTTSSAYTASITYTLANMTSDFAGGINTTREIKFIYYVQNARGIQSNKFTYLYKNKQNPISPTFSTLDTFIASKTAILYIRKGQMITGNGTFTRTNTYNDGIYENNLVSDQSGDTLTSIGTAINITAAKTVNVVFRQDQLKTGQILFLKTDAASSNVLSIHYDKDLVRLYVRRGTLTSGVSYTTIQQLQLDLDANQNEIHFTFTDSGSTVVNYYVNTSTATSASGYTIGAAGNIQYVGLGCFSTSSGIYTLTSGSSFDYSGTGIVMLSVHNNVFSAADVATLRSALGL